MDTDQGVVKILSKLPALLANDSDMETGQAVVMKFCRNYMAVGKNGEDYEASDDHFAL